MSQYNGASRLRWVGHVIRMETDDQVFKICLGRVQEQTDRDRPKLKRQDGMEAVKDWLKKARDRERFQTLLRQGKTAKRLQR